MVRARGILLADNDRPKGGPENKSSDGVDSWLRGRCATPIDGCTPRKRAAIPETPEHVLELLNARLDLDEVDRSWNLVDSAPTLPCPSSGPGQSMFDDETALSADMTPGPVVIGVEASLESSKSRNLFVRKVETTSSPWHEPAAKNTPAEPVASVRVRQMASEREAASRRSAEPPCPTNVCDDRVVTATELTPAAQYVPPMRPPESVHGHVASQPKVLVVPDCDAKIRTARSLRRQSSVPPAMRKVLGFGQGWPLYLAVAGIACAMAVGVVRNFASTPSDRDSTLPDVVGSPRSGRLPDPLDSTPGLASQSSPSEQLRHDAGLNIPIEQQQPQRTKLDDPISPKKERQLATPATSAFRKTDDMPAPQPTDSNAAAGSKGILLF